MNRAEPGNGPVSIPVTNRPDPLFLAGKMCIMPGFAAIPSRHDLKLTQNFR